MNDFELARNSYKPRQIILLFIAESPPQGGTFFYFQNSNLYRAVKEGFISAIGKKIESNFLANFKSYGCYLDDLCLIPVNKLDNAEKLGERRKGIIPLSYRIKIINPKGVIILMKGIEKDVKEAIRLANLTSLEFITTTSFPANSEKNRIDCIEGVSRAITNCISKNIINLSNKML